MIRGLNSYNLLTEKVAKRVFWKIYRPDEKKLKKYWRVGSELSIKEILKAPKYESYLSSQACQKKMMEFTLPTLTIYWPRNIAKKQLTVEKNLYIYVSTKHLST